MSWLEIFIEEAESFASLTKILEEFLSSANYIIEENGEKYLIETRARVDTIDGYKIEVYSDEHTPPHFHIVKNGKKLASYRIHDCKKLEGKIPSALEKKVLYFHEHAKDKLIKFWNDTRPGNCEIGKIV